MNIAQAIVLGVLQGLTEFLPVSSSGHMVLAKSLMGIQSPGALWEVALHLGTLLAIVIVFRRDLYAAIAGFLLGAGDLLRGRGWGRTWRERDGFRMGCYIVLGTLPAAAVGLLLTDAIDGLFSRPILSAAMIFATGEILWLSRPYGLLRSRGEIRAGDSLVMGVAQAVAILPGISRSGATISAGLMRGVDRDAAARFSFLLSIPAILGATVLQTHRIAVLPPDGLLIMALGIAVAAATGYLALRVLLGVVRAGKLHCFAYYCWAVAIVAAALLWAATPSTY